MNFFKFCLIFLFVLSGCSNFHNEIGLNCKSRDKSATDEMYIILNSSIKKCDLYPWPLSLRKNGDISFMSDELIISDEYYFCLAEPGIEINRETIIGKTYGKAILAGGKIIDTLDFYECELTPPEEIRAKVDEKLGSFIDKRKI